MTDRTKTAREREIDRLLERAGHDETAAQLQHRIRLNGGDITDVAFEIRSMTGLKVSPKSMAAWWGADPVPAE